MSLDPFKNAIHTWLKKEVGEELSSDRAVIWAEENGPRPKRPYATLKLVTPSQKPMGKDNLRQVTDPVTSATKFFLNGPRRMFVDINIFGDGAVQLLTKARDSLDNPIVIEFFECAGMQVEQEGTVSNETELLESAFQQRARMSMVFGFTFEREIDLKTVKELEINGTTYNVGS